MIEGKISEASTRAPRDSWIRETASSVSCGRVEMCSARFGRTLARTRTMIRVSSKSCSIPSERSSPPSSSIAAEGCVRQRFLAMSTIIICTSSPSVSAKRSKSSMASEKTASWKIALPDTDGLSIFFKAERIPMVCTSALGESLPGRVTKASITIPKSTKKKATGSSR